MNDKAGMTLQETADQRFLHLAARFARRGHGVVEPNPMVGCVIVSSDGQIVGCGHHQRFGGPHAEVEALRDAGAAAHGATAYVTLEPCNHHGKTPPCTEALIAAGIRQVVIARRDPNPVAAGGIERLRSAGVTVRVADHCEHAIHLTDPFAYRLRSGLPWVIAKWAQTIDGAMAISGGEGRWISGPSSRRLVHLERGRVDAILTAIGTVLADDPLLTARDVPRRRIARRVIIDPRIETPLQSRIVQTARDIPTTLAASRSSLSASGGRARDLQDCGIVIVDFPDVDGELPLAAILRELVTRHNVTNVLTEAGPGLLTRLFRDKLVRESWVFTNTRMTGETNAIDSGQAPSASRIHEGARMTQTHSARRGDDVIARYRVS